MSHCHDEHHHHHDDGHDHTDDLTPALQSSLYEYIIFDDMVTFNERQSGSGRAIAKKTWAERLSPSPELVSDDDDPQILMNIPFTGQIKLHSILLRTSASSSAPRTLRVWANRDDLDLESAEEQNRSATQTLELAQTSEVQEVPVKRALFGAVHALTLFFQDNFAQGDEEDTRVSYLGFRGEWRSLGKAPARIVYEAAAQPGDHKVKGTEVRRMGSGI